MAENGREPEKVPEQREFDRQAAQKTGLDAVARAARTAGEQAGEAKLPPVHLWNPPHCGDIGLRIGSDGTWYYQESPIGRAALVKLFSSVLRKDEDDYVLVTPVEKISVEVEDAPFVAVEVQRESVAGRDILSFRTNVDEWVCAGPDHPLRFEETSGGAVKPYLHVRSELWALVNRPVFYELVSHGITRTVDGKDMFGVCSDGAFFAMAPAENLEID